MLRPSSTLHAAKMAAVIRALFLLIFFSQFLHAAPVEPVPTDINIPAVNSDDLSRQVPPENEPEPSSENDNENNTYPDPNGEPEYNWFPPGISLSTCRGFFRFSVNITDPSLNTTQLFPYPNNSDEEFDVLRSESHVLSCKASPDDEKEGEMTVSCRCGNVRLSVFDTVYVWVMGFVLIFCILNKILEPRGRNGSAKDENVRNDYNTVHQPGVYQRVSETGSEVEMEGYGTDETVVDDEVGEDFDDSNYPMG